MIVTRRAFLPNLSPLSLAKTAISAKSGDLGLDEMAALKVYMVVQNDINDLYIADDIPLGIKWEDGDESFAYSGLNLSKITIVLRKDHSKLEITFKPHVYQYAIEWGDITSVLFALARFYTTITSLWAGKVWNNTTDILQTDKAVDQAVHMHTLVKMLRESVIRGNTSNELSAAALSYQRGSYLCHRMALSGSDVECEGKPKQYWLAQVTTIRSHMIKIPFDMYVASVAEDFVDLGAKEFVFKHFVSTTLNFRALDDGFFDTFESDDNKTLTVLAMWLRPGTRVFPMYAAGGNKYAWEFEVVIDAGQTATVLDVHVIQNDKTVVSIVV